LLPAERKTVWEWKCCFCIFRESESINIPGTVAKQYSRNQVHQPAETLQIHDLLLLK